MRSPSKPTGLFLLPVPYIPVEVFVVWEGLGTAIIGLRIMDICIKAEAGRHY